MSNKIKISRFLGAVITCTFVAFSGCGEMTGDTGSDIAGNSDIGAPPSILGKTVVQTVTSNDGSQNVIGVGRTITYSFIDANTIKGAGLVTLPTTSWSYALNGNAAKVDLTYGGIGWAKDTWTFTSPTGGTYYSDTGLSSGTHGWHKGTFTVEGYTGGTPTVTGMSPSTAAAGASVTISGTNFSTTPANNTVMFNGTPATVTAATATSLTVTVPSGATPGPVTVITSIGAAATSASNFTNTESFVQLTLCYIPFTFCTSVNYDPAHPNPAPNCTTTTYPHYVNGSCSGTTSSVPTVSGMSPTSGAAGTPVTITGTNFSTTPANNTVKFNGTTATVTTATATSLTTTVPSGATTGAISVTTAGGTVTSNGSFTVTPGDGTTGSFICTPSSALANCSSYLQCISSSNTCGANTGYYSGNGNKFWFDACDGNSTSSAAQQVIDYCF